MTLSIHSKPVGSVDTPLIHILHTRRLYLIILCLHDPPEKHSREGVPILLLEELRLRRRPVTICLLNLMTLLLVATLPPRLLTRVTAIPAALATTTTRRHTGRLANLTGMRRVHAITIQTTHF